MKTRPAMFVILNELLVQANRGREIGKHTPKDADFVIDELRSGCRRAADRCDSQRG
jgi:hypothetical protein